MEAILANGISFQYEEGSHAPVVLSDLSLAVASGEWIAVLGPNGCGKTTLFRLCNALLPLQSGELTVAGLNVQNEDTLWELRRRCGMVFQNPDNQFVSSVVEEDVAFGLENYDTPPEEIPKRVAKALEAVGLPDAGLRSPHTLSGGQKQRAALAGVLVMEPDLVIFDEATAMLDPAGRAEVLCCMRQMRQQGRTVVMITHYVEEAVLADRVVLMQEGRILAVGTPAEILTDRDLLETAGLEPPMPVRMYYDLLDRGIRLSRCPLTEETLVEELCRLH